MSRSQPVDKALIPRLARIVKAFSHGRLGVVGDLMLDRYIWGKPTKLSPEAPVPVVELEREESVLGGAGNVAANMASFNAQVVPFGVVGEDDHGSAVRSMVRALNMPLKGILTDSSRKTTVKTRVIAGHQQVVRVDRESRTPLGNAVEEKLIRLIVSSLRSLRALVLSDYDKGVVSENLAGRVLRGCSKLGLQTFVKPKWSRQEKYPGATMIVLNRQEASFMVSRTLENDESVQEAGRALLAHFGCRAVVITRGERGMSIFEQDTSRALHISATSEALPVGRLGLEAAHRSIGRQVFDVTGAGDTVLAMLALAVAAGASLQDAAVLANAAAGVVVGKLGTSTLSPAELLAALHDLG
jgi:D-beta-D-heptose 7-phosphate kinase/D-beta-D-heptose 1-phosphate adenosyltransferase